VSVREIFGKELKANLGARLEHEDEARTVQILKLHNNDIGKSYERVDASTATVRVRQNDMVIIILNIAYPDDDGVRRAPVFRVHASCRTQDPLTGRGGRATLITARNRDGGGTGGRLPEDT